MDHYNGVEGIFLSKGYEDYSNVSLMRELLQRDAEIGAQDREIQALKLRIAELLGASLP